MQCPFCNFDNIEGVDQCERCDVALTNVPGLKDKSEIELDLLRRPLGDLLSRDYAVVPPDTPVREVVRRFDEDGYHCAVVVDGERIAGIFTERDVLFKLAGEGRGQGTVNLSATSSRAPGLPEIVVARYMTPDPETLGVDDAVAFGLNRMMVGGYRHIPIEREGKLAGVVSVRHILGYLLDRFGDPDSPENAHE